MRKKIIKPVIGEFYKNVRGKVFKCVLDETMASWGKESFLLETSDGNQYAWFPIRESPYLVKVSDVERLRWYDEREGICEIGD